jgi:hypothetical protein
LPILADGIGHFERDKDFSREGKARITQVKKTIGDGEILDACICIQKSICNRPFPTRENIDKAKANTANGKDILGKEAFAIAGIRTIILACCASNMRTVHHT